METHIHSHTLHVWRQCNNFGEEYINLFSPVFGLVGITGTVLSPSRWVVMDPVFPGWVGAVLEKGQAPTDAQDDLCWLE